MKTIIKTLFVLSLASSLLYCSGEGLIDTDPNADVSELGTLNISAVHSLEDDGVLAANPDGHKELSSDAGFDLHLTELQINWQQLRLISSGADPECVGGSDQTIALNQVEDILGLDLVETPLGEAAIPLTGYCSYEVTIAPTLAAAIKFHEGEDHGGAHSGIEVSFHAQGEWSKGVDSGSFHYESTDPVKISGQFTPPLHFHEGEAEADLNFGTHYDIFFSGIDFAADDEATQQAKFVSNLKTALHRHSDGH